MVLSYASSAVSSVRDKDNHIVGLWVTEVVTWDGIEVTYNFPNDVLARDAMQGYLWRLKSWMHTTAGVGAGHAFYLHTLESMLDPVITTATHVLGRFLWADTEAFGQIYDVGPLHDAKTAWQALIAITADTAPTNLGTSTIYAFYERVD